MIFQQNIECTNVILRLIRITIVAVGKQKVLHTVCVCVCCVCLCSLIYAAYKHIRRIILMPFGSGSTIFVHNISQKSLYLE